jgi:hypothetical protein
MRQQVPTTWPDRAVRNSAHTSLTPSPRLASLCSRARPSLAPSLRLQSNAEGTATTFRWPDLDGGELFDTDGSQSRFGTVNGVDRSKFLKDDRQ